MSLPISTGLASVRDTDELLPWAIATESFEALREALGGMTFDALGVVIVNRERWPDSPKMWFAVVSAAS